MLKNYDSFCVDRDITHKNGDVGMGPDRSTFSSVKRKWILSLVLLLSIFGLQDMYSQANLYTYAASTGNTLETITSPTVVTTLSSGTADDGSFAVSPAGFTFKFNGVDYTQFGVSTNGWLQFGNGTVQTARPSAINTFGAVNVVAVFERDGNLNLANGGNLTHGPSAGGKYVFQLVKYSGGGSGSASATIYADIQIVLWGSTSATPGRIEIIYGTSAGTPSTSGVIGIADAAATFVNGVNGSTSLTTTASAWPVSGTKYSFSAPPVCTTPVDRPTGLNRVSSTIGSISYSFSAPSVAPFAYLVVRYPTGSAITSPVNGTSYTAGTALGLGTIVATNSALSGTTNGLSPGTNYVFYVYSYNGGTCSGGPLYNMDALTATLTTATATLSGVKTVGPTGDYASLTAAFNAINTSGLINNIDLQLQAAYVSTVETFPIVSPSASAGSGYVIKVYPEAGAVNLSITSANTSGTLHFNGGAKIIIDGRANQTGPKQLTISNTNLGASYAILFSGDAVNNTVQYCNIRSVNNSLTSGTIVFGTGVSTGNDGNTLSFNDIFDGTSTPNNAIYSAGSTTNATLYNDNNIVSNNNVYNFFSAGSASNGLLVAAGNAGWTISDNSFYQTATRTYTSGNTHTAINVSNASNGNGFVISGNYIGGSQALAGGTAYTMAGTVATQFRAITLNAGTTSVSNVQGNVVRNIVMNTSSAPTSYPGFFSGINVTGGLVDVGNTSGNVIGANTGTGSIVVTSSTTGGYFSGIYLNSASTTNIQNNTVSSISTGAGAAIGYQFSGITATGTAAVRNISGNTIGSDTANAITLGLAGVTPLCVFNGIGDSGTVTTLTMNNNIVKNTTILSAIGNIYAMRSAGGQYTVSGNQIFNNKILSSTSSTTASLIYGYYNFAGPTNEVISNNNIYNLSIDVNNTSTSNAISGIHTNTITGTRNTNGNTVRDLTFTNSGTGSVALNGIYSVTSSPNIFKNKIYNLSAINGAASTVYGINSATGTTVTIYNNIIGALTAPVSSLGVAPSVAGIYVTSGGTVNAYFNTVRLSGSGGANFGSAAMFVNTAATSVNLRNNIFVNAATASGTGKTVAYQRSSTTLSSYAATSNNNLFYAGTPSAANVIYFDGTSSDQTLSDFKTRMVSRDQNSYTENLSFLSIVGSDSNFLHLDPLVSTQVESGGVAIPGITDDFDGNVRNVSTPDVGADEFAGSSPAPSVSALTSTPNGNQCSATARVISATATTPAGTITGVQLAYSYNGVSQTPIAMTNTSGNIWEGTIPAATPTNATVVWSVTATSSLAITATASGTSYHDDPYFGKTASATASLTTVCNGSSSVLTAIATNGLPVVVGSGATTSATYPNPFYTNWGHSKNQYLVLASELTAQGMIAGNINSLGINITSGTTALTNFSVQMANSNATTMATFVSPAFTAVYNNALLTPVVGLNTLTFSTPFVWDGTSNIVIQTCFGNGNTTTVSSTVEADNTSYVSVAHWNVTSTTNAASTCSQATANATYSVRPKFTFGSPQSLAGTSVTWSGSNGYSGTGISVTVNPTVTETYTATITVNGCVAPSNPTVTVNVLTIPTAPTIGNTTQCGAGIPTATVTSTSGLPTPTFKWYSAATDGTVMQNSASTTYTTSINATTTFYVAEVNGTCESSRTAVTITVQTPPAIIVTPTGASTFCGTGGSGVLTASSTDDPAMTYVWSVYEGNGTVDSDVDGVLNYTVTTTTTFRATGTGVANPNCTAVIRDFTVSIFPLPLATLSTNVNGVCAGTGSATLTSDLAAGNFASNSIAFAALTAPVSATTLVSGGTALVTPAATTTPLDDGGWGGIPIGFNFSFFGTTYTTINVGTNGTLQFGALNTNGATAPRGLSDYEFATLPSATEPFNMVAVLAIDNDLRSSENLLTPLSPSGVAGTIKYWTEGVSPNRKFIVSYEDVREFGDTKTSTAQAIFYETTGIVEVHVTASSNTDRNKLVGINNGNGTIGALAYASGTTASATNPIVTPFAYRFVPPSNYATVWSKKDSTTSGAFVPFASGTNLFSQVVNPTETTIYDLSYTNQTTGCTSATNASQVTVTVISTTAPATTAISNISTICVGSIANLSLTGNVNSLGNKDGLSYQWEVSTDGGSTWANVAGATSETLAVSPTQPSAYRAQVASCGGTPTASSSVTLDFANSITATTPNGRCGVGTVQIGATANAGATVNWYAASTGGAILATGSSFTTPFLNNTTTFYASAQGGIGNVPVGPASPAVGTYGSSFVNSYQIFTAANATVLHSVDVYPTSAGTVIVQLMDSSGTVLQTAPTYTVTAAQANTTLSVIGTPVTVPVNFSIPVGTGYRLNLGGTSTAGMVRNDTGAAATYGPIGGLTITGNSNAAVGYFYNFYNWIVDGTCESGRTPVIASINTAPDLMLSTNSLGICPSATSSVVTITAGGSSYDQYTWSPNTNITGDAVNGWQFNPSVSTVYTLTAVDTVGTCQSIVNLTVVVDNPEITSVTATPATLCNNGISTLVANYSLYNFATSTGATLHDMTGAVEVMPAGSDDAPTATPSSIGFTFNFGGVNYSDYSVSPDGWILLGSAVASSQFTNAVVSTTNTPKLYPFWDDLAAGTNGNVKTLVTGIAPNRIFIVEWNTTIPRNTSGTANAKMQAWLYETSNVIEYRYGAMGATTSASASAGFTINATTYSSISFATNTASTTTPNNANTVPPTSGRMYSYTPSVNVTWSPLTDLFTDSAATIAYTGQSSRVVYSKPSATTQYTATSMSINGCTDAKNVTVTNNSINIANITGGANSYCIGESTPLDFDTTTPGVTWTSSNTAVATINSSGVVTVLTAGTTIIGATITNSGCTTVALNPQTVVIHDKVTIVSSTESQTVVTDGNTSFNVSATGSGLTYQWQVNTGSGFVPVVNDAVYSGATTATLTLTSVPESYNGNVYHVIVTGLGICTSKTTTDAPLLVGSTGISAQPSDVNVCEGAGTVSFTVVGSGDIVSYEWEYNIGSGNVWTALADDTVYSGSNTATLSVQNYTLVYNGFKYRAVIVGSATSAVSNAATLNINEAVIASAPVNANVCYSGGSASFTSVTTGVITSRQWQYSANGTTWTSVANGTPAGASYTGNTTGTLNVTTTASTPLAGTYFYRLFVDAPLCADVTSATAQMILYRPSATAPATQSFCAGSATSPINLVGTPAGVTFNVSGGAAIGLANQTGVTQIPSFSAIAGTAVITLTPIANGCTGPVSTFIINVQALPTELVIAPANPTICTNAVQAITTTGGNVTVAVVSGTGANTTLPNTTAATLGPNPFQNYYGSTKQQSIYLASELTALGLVAGNSVTAINFELVATNGTALQNLRVRMKNTNTASFATTSSWESTSLVDVRPAATLNPVVGQNTIALTTPFIWDGTSNVVLEFSYTNLNAGSGSTNTIKYSPTSFASTLFYRVDSATSTVSAIQNYTGAATNSLNFRTDFTFSVLQAGSVVWSPQSGLYTDAQATLPYQGTNARTVYTKIATPSVANYTATVTSSIGCVNSSEVVVTAVEAPIGGTLPSNQFICGGSTPSDLTLSGSNGTIVKWQKATDMAFTSPVDITNTSSTLTGAEIGAVLTTTYIRAVLQGCSTVYSTVATITAASTIWTGGLAGSWSNGIPNTTMAAIIASNYSSTADLSACSLIINGNATVTVNTGHDFNISGAVTVTAGSTLTFENKANLLQDVATVTNSNTGNILAKRPISLRRLDYAYWGSPVANQNLKLFSPQTVSPPVGASRFYEYNEGTNSFSAVDPVTEEWIDGKGFMVRAPNNFPVNGNLATFPGEFTGVPNNGTYTIGISSTSAGFNMLGNPYPSAIDADEFLNTNPGTLYYWTHQNQVTTGSNYATYNDVGQTTSSGGITPTKFIPVGQGFLLQNASNATQAVFTNAMRAGDNQGQLFRGANVVEKHRIWLNLSNASNPLLNQMLVGYLAGATEGIDPSMDGKQSYTGSSISSNINATAYVTQGRSLPFNVSDVVPLIFKAETAGDYTISIDHVDGLFSADQDIFLKDNLTGAEQNLKSGAYTFVSEAGNFDSRFSMIYQTTLGVENPTFDANTIVVYKDNGVLHINAGTTTMSKVRIFDIRGRLIYEKDGINSTTTSLNDLRAEQQVLLVQITSDQNRMVTKKVIN